MQPGESGHQEPRQLGGLDPFGQLTPLLGRARHVGDQPLPGLIGLGDHGVPGLAQLDRRNKKRDLRSLWITRINAAARLNGTTYGKLIAGIKQSNIELDRKVLAEMAVNEPEAFATVVKAVTK